MNLVALEKNERELVSGGAEPCVCGWEIKKDRPDIKTETELECIVKHCCIDSKFYRWGENKNLKQCPDLSKMMIVNGELISLIPNNFYPEFYVPNPGSLKFVDMKSFK